MEKLFYVLWQPGNDAVAFTEALLALQINLGDAQRVRVGVPDVPLPREDPYAAMRQVAPAGYVSFWLNSAYRRAAAEAAITAIAPRLAGYVVAESTILPARTPACGAREDGFMQVCGFAALPGLTRADLWRHWLGTHTDVAVGTQATIFYNQNVVVRPLTEHAPAWDAIVEERFPAAALDDRAVYFDSVGDGAKLDANMAAMAQSCARFIDFNTITLMNCGEYRFGGWRDGD